MARFIPGRGVVCILPWEQWPRCYFAVSVCRQCVWNNTLAPSFGLSLPCTSGCHVPFGLIFFKLEIPWPFPEFLRVAGTLVVWSLGSFSAALVGLMSRCDINPSSHGQRCQRACQYRGDCAECERMQLVSSTLFDNQEVNEGDCPGFVIDPRPFERRLQRAKC